MAKTVFITGNTFPVKDALKALGARWSAGDKMWTISADKLEEAQKIVANPPAVDPNAPKPVYRRTTCVACGRQPTGRYGDHLYRSGECNDCFEERKMGY